MNSPDNQHKPHYYPHLQKIADRIHATGLSQPARLLLEMNRPLFSMGVGFYPFLEPVFGSRNFVLLKLLGNRPRALEALLEMMEQDGTR